MKRLKLLLVGISFLSLVAAPVAASADVNDFTVTNFVANETLSRADRQGELHVVEYIYVNFTDDNHGILRAIPQRYKGHSLQLHVNKVSSNSGAPAQYTTYGSNGNTVLKIGDPNRTVTGPQEYTIDYTLRNVISFYNDHDELYWNINGDQWEQPFDNVSVSLQLPAGLQQSRDPVCYTGASGSTSQACTATYSNGIIESANTQELLPNQTLTIVAGFKKGFFKPSTLLETAGEYTKQITEFFVPLLALGGSSFIYWWLRGRDPKGTGIIVPQYGPPDGLKPAVVGTIIDFKLDNRDITATIIDLAIRGYLKIVENTQERKFRPNSRSYAIQQTSTNFSSLDVNETILMRALFNSVPAGNLVDVSALRNSLYTTAKTLQASIDGGLTADGYFRSNPLNAGKFFIIPLAIGGFAAFFAGSAIGLPASAGIILGVIIGFLCVRGDGARTAKGVAAKEQILGLKMYLSVAEAARLEALQGPDAKYAEASPEPVRTIELFEKLLPYAMVLGVETQWATKFNSLYTSPPSWYVGGNWSTLNALYLAQTLNEGIGSAVDTAFSAPSSSGSSGFGGGFAGGGGGGGGGGGW